MSPLLAQSGHGLVALHMSAFGGKADMPFALHMSAFDPKRTETGIGPFLCSGLNRYHSGS